MGFFDDFKNAIDPNLDAHIQQGFKDATKTAAQFIAGSAKEQLISIVKNPANGNPGPGETGSTAQLTPSQQAMDALARASNWVSAPKNLIPVAIAGLIGGYLLFGRKARR